jgi:catecholate siderophore receptor
VLKGTEALAQTVGDKAAAMLVETPESGGGQQVSESSAHQFNIPAGSVVAAFDAYQKTTGVHLEVNIPADKLAGVHTEGLQGIYPDIAGLKMLLDKTGLSLHISSRGNVEIGIRNSEQVDVHDSVSSISMQQFPESLLDTAQTVTTVPQFILEDQAATTLRDGLRNIPGISMAAGEGGSQGDTLTIRGFNARNDIFLDGIRDFGSYYRDAFDYESIDVLQGPAGIEFGRGSTGGVVNQESKQPLDHELIKANLQLGTNLMRRVSADINEPLKGIAGAAFRVNVVGTQTMFAERNVTEVRRFGIAPALEFGMNTSTRYGVQYLHESENTTPDYGLPYFGKTVVDVNTVGRKTYYGYAADNYLRTSPDIVSGKVEHDFSSHVTVRNVLRWANYPRDVRITEPQINSVGVVANPTAIGGAIAVSCNPGIANNPTGSPATIACYPVNTPISQLQLKRNQIVVRSTEDLLWDQVTTNTHFDFFHIGNDAVVIVEGGRERSTPVRNGYTMAYIPVLNPNPYSPFAPLATTVGLPTHVTSQSFGIGFNDTVKLRDWLLLSGGVRFDYFSTTAVNPPSTTAVTGCIIGQYCSAERLDKQPTYRAAVVYKPKPEGSVYFDWGTSFNPSAESLSLSGNNATAAPEENETYELGAKWAYFRDRLDVSGSIFRTEKDNAHETDPTNSLNTITVGTYKVRGLQFAALGHLPQHFDISVGYAILDAYLANSILNASPFAATNLALIKLNDPRANTAPYYINPNRFPIANVPRNGANVWVTHSILKGFVGGFGANYTGARRASSGSLIALYNQAGPVDPATVPLGAKSIPQYVIFSAMLQHPITDHLDFQINVNNLANRFYIDEPHPGHLVPGEGANAQFSVNYKF